MLMAMIDDDLNDLCAIAWERASFEERQALIDAASATADAAPAEVFTAIARQAQRLDPSLTSLLWDELSVKRHINRIELGDLTLSEPVSLSLQMALARELGERIDKVLAELGGAANDAIKEGELMAKSDAAGLPWQVVSYAITRERERGKQT